MGIRAGGDLRIREERRQQRARTNAAMRWAVLLAVPATVLTMANPAQAANTSSSAEVTDSSPVKLATPVDMADGMAHQAAIVHAGDARIEVLSPTLLRLEYAPSGNFENSPTVNAIDRRMPVPRYSIHVAGGWLTLETSKATLRYKIGSGPFTTKNTSLQFSDGGKPTTVNPTWDWECPADQICQAGAATLGGGANLSQSFNGYQSTAGYVSNFTKAGASATWKILGAAAGSTTLTLRYSTYPVPVNAPPVRNFDLVVNGRTTETLTAPPSGTTYTAAVWTTLSTTADLHRGTNSIELRCGAGQGCDTDFDTLSVSPSNAAPPIATATGPLGGWIRGLDTQTYNVNPTCTSGQQGATCQANIQALNTDGLLDTSGWRLLDDTQSAIWTRGGWVQPRPKNGDVEDGYLFVYGHNYAGALRTLKDLTGPAPLLPRSVFGVWYSDYTPYSSATIENTLYPQFVSNDVPLNTLSLDTDWKAPNNWNGWEWNTTLFPDADAFLKWAHARGIDLTLNVHSSIDDNDPKLPAAERIAGKSLAASTCTNGPCKVWDWSSIAQAESNFSLQQSFQRQGVSFWWLDWCCDASVVSMPGLTPDAWIDHLYAQEMVNQGQRGFVLARVGGSNGNPEEVYAAGPWSNHTSTIAFTGDAWGTWNTLAQEAALTPAEATIGEPYVSDDIGSYLGPPPTQSGADPPDLYDRWVQLGTFQPILRLHSNNEDRLPWQYPQPVRNITETFLRLRESLIPYTYTLAAQANQTGLPMTRPLYLDYPNQPAAYDNPTEYLYGPDMLVAPVTTPGDVTTTNVWFPPGRWVDYFTGATFTGPSTVPVSEPLSRMPVFIRAGGIVPEQPSTESVGTGDPHSLSVIAYPGSTGTFSIYNDAGTGLGYTKGQHTETLVTTTTNAHAGQRPSTRVTIGAARGGFPGQTKTVRYHVELPDLSRPSDVSLNGRPLAELATGSGKTGWTYQPSDDTVTVNLGPTSVSHSLTLVESGGGLVQRAEPTLTSSP